MKKLTNSLRDALVTVADALGKGDTETVGVDAEATDVFCDHGLLDFAQRGDGSGNGNWWLTEKGHGVVSERRREREETRAKRNLSSGGRAQAARGLGMRRTLGGGWE